MTDFLNSATRREHPIQGSSFTSYFWAGSGATILFMHGWKSNSARWKQLVMFFQAKGYQCVSIDAPGHGDTAFPFFTPLDYAACMDIAIQEFQPKFVVSHSAGAYSAIIHHGKYQPEGIKHILLAPTFSMNQPTGTMFEILGLNQRMQKAFTKHLEGMLGARIETIQIDQMVDAENPQGILIHDVNDRVIPIEGARVVTQKAKGLEYYEINNNGHRMQNDEVFEIITGYVSGYS